MKSLVALAITLHIIAISSSGGPDLSIGAVVVQLDTTVYVVDAESRRPISGATVVFTRSKEAELFTPEDSVGSVETQKTNNRGIARLTVKLPGNLCSCGWVEAYPGNSFLAVTVPHYAAAKAWVTTPTGRLGIDSVANGKVSLQPLDKIRFQGTEVRRKITYRVSLRRAGA